MTTSLADQFEALKPCPFCGDRALMQQVATVPPAFRVGCAECDCVLEIYQESEADAIVAWNTRAAISSALTATPPVQEGPVAHPNRLCNSCGRQVDNYGRCRTDKPECARYLQPQLTDLTAKEPQ